jgi:hypothetical protein
LQCLVAVFIPGKRAFLDGLYLIHPVVVRIFVGATIDQQSETPRVSSSKAFRVIFVGTYILPFTV